ncbi:MAG: hypothetical protein JWN85_4800 [Gammaproteobacteria bacterium]|nr:hypothetical protein [Gammaproteobacteria bacterium]
MQEGALRKVLLIQAIEETDRTGEVLPLAERMEATRAVLGTSPPPVETQAEAPLSSATEWFLARRADVLLQSLRTRSPGIDHVLAVAGGVTSLDRGMLVLAFVAGMTLSLLDGGHGINLFAPPLVALIAWNLLIYIVLLARTRAERKGHKPDTSWFGSFYARWVRNRIDRLLGHSTRFNAPLAPGLRRFAGDWWEIAQPLFRVRARRLLHLAAALTAVGLVAGYCIRGLVLRFPAGWESNSFVGPQSAHALLVLLYGPASVVTGIGIASAETIAALRWSAPSIGGGDASAWIYLIAVTAGLYIVLPRLVAALLSTIRLWRLSRRLPLPAGLSAYVRTLFAGARDGPA